MNGPITILPVDPEPISNEHHYRPRPLRLTAEVAMTTAALVGTIRDDVTRSGVILDDEDRRDFHDAATIVKQRLEELARALG